MTSLNEHDQQLLETLLNQADAVSPNTEKSHHNEHRGFNTPEHDFQLLDSYINNEMGDDMEPMQFEQQPGGSGYRGQQQGARYQQQAAGSGFGCKQQAPTYSDQQLTAGSGYSGQQQASSSGYSSQPGSGSQYVSQQQVVTPGYSGQQQGASSGYNHQQASASNPPTPSDVSFQNPGSVGLGGQQGGYPVGAAVQSPLQMDQASTGDYHVQSPSYKYKQVQGIVQGQNSAEGQQYQQGSGMEQSSAVHFQTDLSTFTKTQTQNEHHQQTNTFHQGASAGHLNTGYTQEQQASPFQVASPAPSQVDQNNAATKYPGHVSKFQNQQSFQSPVGSPCQSEHSVTPSPSSFVQPSPEYGSQQVGSSAGYQAGQLRQFQKQTSFHSPAPSPGQPLLDQPTYQGTGQTASAGEEQAASVNYNPQTPVFSPASHNSAFSPAAGDQTVSTNFQGAQTFNQKAPSQTNQSVGSFQAQPSEFGRQFSAPGDQNLAAKHQSQTAGFQQQAFHTRTDADHQPMEDGSDHMSIEVKASAILQETLQAHIQTSTIQDKGMHDYQTATSEYQAAAQTSQYQAVQTSQYQASPSSQYQAAQTGTSTSQYQTTQLLPFQQSQTSQYQQVASSYTQRDQPMEAQASLVDGSEPNSEVYQGFTPGSAQSTAYTTPAVSSSNATGSSFLNQALTFHTTGYSAQSVSDVGQSAVISNTTTGQFGSAATFSQFQTLTSGAFEFSQASSDQRQMQHPQYQQSQQVLQQQIQAQHLGTANLVQNNTSHVLSAQMNDTSHILPTVSNQNVSPPEAQVGLGTFTQPTALGLGSQPAQMPSQLSAHSLTQGTAGTVHSNSTPQLPITTISQRTPEASLIDSNQANAALNLLASLLNNQNLLQGLQGLQALLPPNNQAGGDPNLLSKLLQTRLQQNSQQPAQSVQQQHFQPQQQQSGQVQPPAQGGHFPQEPAAHQQPNFLLQQLSPQPQTFPPLQQHSQQMPTPSPQPQQQQHIVQIPASAVGNLSSYGITMGSDGQLMLGEQGLKIFLQTSTVTSTASGSTGTQAAPVTVQSVGSHSAALTTTVTPSGLSGPPSGTFRLATGFGLPSDLQNISVQPFSSTASNHANAPVACVPPSIEASISLKTNVTPTSSFFHPVPAVGVPVSSGSLPGVSSGSKSIGDSFTFLASHPNVPVAQNSHSNLGVSVSSSAITPSVANIFYPASPAGAYTKPATEVSQGVTVSVKNFLNVTTGSASSLLNAFKMALADGHSGTFSSVAVSASENFFPETAKPMEIGQGDGKMDTSETDLNEPVIVSASGVRPMEMDRPVLDLASGHSSRKSSIEEDVQKAEASSMLRRILTMKDDDPGDPPNPSDMLLESPTSVSPPIRLGDNTQHEVFDGNTQATLIEQSQKLQLESEAQNEDDFQDNMWVFPSSPSSPVDEVVPSKVLKGLDDLDASSVQISVPSVEKLFDAGGASSCSSFVFTKFGADVPNSVFTFGNSQTNTAVTSVTDTRPTTTGTSFVSKSDTVNKSLTLPTASVQPSSRKQKDPSLTSQFPSKMGEYELRILTQPEEQHRARYLTEGSRGAVKDRSQQGYPVIKLHGYNEPATLQIFIGGEGGRVKPHGFYQACKVCGKNSTPCTEGEIDGTNVIEIEMSPINDMQISMDCVGILKLRNADVEKRIGPSKAKAHKKNSTKARLVFRVCLRKPDGTFFTLQTVSSPILCTQPIGQPEISRMSISELCVNQTGDLFIIGKNFLKGTQIHFQELGPDSNEIIWQAEAEIEAEYFQQSHLICRIPSYPKKDLERPVHVQIVAISGGKTSEPQEFIFKPAFLLVKDEDPMETEPSASGKALPFGVSPVALQLNRLVERTQHHSTSNSLFQLPPGAVPSIAVANGTSLTSVPMSSGFAQSVVKPTAFSLPPSGQPIFPAPSRNSQDGMGLKSVSGAVPLQLVLPALSPGQTPRLLLMNTPVSQSANSTTPISPSVFTLNGFSTASSGVSAGSTTATHQPGSQQGNSSPMIIVLTGQASSVSSNGSNDSNSGGSSGGSTGTVVGSANNCSNNHFVPLAVNQPATSGQVESLLKQILEASKPSSS